MLRYIVLIGIVLALAYGLQASAGTPQLNGPKASQVSRLQQFRERQGSGPQVDLSVLKKMTWTIDGVAREALVYLPPATVKNPPVVFAFHGHGGNEANAARRFAIHVMWPEAICVYPQGLPTAVPIIDPNGKMPGWQKFAGDEKDRDLNFFDAMLKQMKADYHADEKRVYVTGHSNGGFFTYILWEMRGDELTAIAPISAYAAIAPKDPKKMKPLPVFHVAGQKDPIVNFDTQMKTVDRDRKIDGCDPIGKPAGEFLTEYTSKTGPPVETFIHPGGHEIPDGAPQQIVKFFKQFPKS